jgi:hypothetical protein
MPPRERQRRDWVLHFEITGTPIKPGVFFHLDCSSSY